jgi:hypothetical protein
LQGYLEERPAVTIGGAAMVAACLAALDGEQCEEATRTLQAMTDRC